jgi:hypothetical protein
MRDDFVVVENWLDEDRANDIAKRIDQIQDWNARICDKDGGPRIIEHASLQSLGITAQEYARSNPESLQELARGGTMAYLFFVKHLSQFDPDLYQWFNDEFVNMANQMTYQENNYIEEPQVTMYSSGCFLGQHTDGVGNRQIAFIANFTSNWQPDFGGCLTLLTKGKWQVVPPKFNSIVLMNVRSSNCHYVSQVASWVQHKRTAITGWVGRR